MLIALKAKILLTILSIVLMFTFFTLFYFPDQQGRLLLKNYNNEIQNLANTVALGVKIALTEQNFNGVETAMEFVKDDPRLLFIAMIQQDTAWNNTRGSYVIKERVFKTFPEKQRVNPAINSSDTIIVKRAPFSTSTLSGAILIAFTTHEIAESKKEIRRTSLLVSGLVFLIASSVGLWLAKHISVPVSALRNAAIQVGKGDLEQRVVNSSRDEIGQLGIAFNKMVEDLSTTRKELNDTNLTLSSTNAALNNAVLVLKSTQAQLVQTEKMASLGELTAGIAHEIQNPLNFINNFSEVNNELIEEMKLELAAGNVKDVIAIVDAIEQNLEKIYNHGRRADAIVKGMLQHSRAATGEKHLTDLNALTEEYLRLSYHGLRAKDKEFSGDIFRDFDQKIGKVKIAPQEIGRVLLNLLNNAFYATNQKKVCTKGSYEPEVKVSTRKIDSNVEIRVWDNGNGIADTVKSRIFQPFFTTKPPGQGTGLGLSISYDIITKGHGGQMQVCTREGEFTEFIITLPYHTADT